MNNLLIGLLVLLSVIILFLVGFVVYYFLNKNNNNKNNQEIDIKTNIESIKTELLDNIKLQIKDLEVKNLENINTSMQQNSKNIAELQLLKEQLTKSIREDVEKLNSKVENRLGEGFKGTNEIISQFSEKLVKIDEAQKGIDKLSSEVSGLSKILGNQKLRGNFGEFQLNSILESLDGNNSKLYEVQYKFSNDKMVDLVIHAPKPLGLIAVDSKFPLENYQRLIENRNEKTIEKAFKEDVKKHIRDISEKYIIRNETSDHAIMFIPAEAIFSDINNLYPDIIKYAIKLNVWITSPTTLLATLTTIQTIIKNIEQNKNAKTIQEQLIKLSIEFERFLERAAKIQKDFNNMTTDLNNLIITSNKITKNFHEIKNVDIKGEIDYDNN